MSRGADVNLGNNVCQFIICTNYEGKYRCYDTKTSPKDRFKGCLCHSILYCVVQYITGWGIMYLFVNNIELSQLCI